MLDQGQRGYFSQFKQSKGKSFPDSKTIQLKDRLQQRINPSKAQKMTEKLIVSNNHADIPSISSEVLLIVQQYAKQNNRLAGQRQALFKKNCQLVNEIKFVKNKYRELVYQKTVSDKLCPDKKSLCPQQAFCLNNQQLFIQQQKDKNKINTNKTKINSQLPRIKNLNIKKNSQQYSEEHEKSSDIGQLDMTKISFNNIPIAEAQTVNLNTQTSNKSRLIEKNIRISKDQDKNNKSNLFSERSQIQLQTSPCIKKILSSKQKKCLGANKKLSQRAKTSQGDYLKGYYNYQNKQIQSSFEKTYLYPKKFNNGKNFLSSQAQEQTTDDIKLKLKSKKLISHEQDCIKILKRAFESTEQEKNLSKLNYILNNSYSNITKNQSFSKNLLKALQDVIKREERKKKSSSTKIKEHIAIDKQKNKKILHTSNFQGFTKSPEIKFNHKFTSTNIKQLDNKIKKIRTQNQKLRKNQ